MEIINAKNINIDELEVLFTDCFNELKDNDSENFNDDNGQDFREWFGIDYLEDYLKYSHVIVAKDNDRLVGGAIVGMQNPLSWPDGRKYELFILGVLPDSRNNGIGKLLVKEVEAVAKEAGAESVILNTHELMVSTQKFYKDLGYEDIARLKKYYGNGSAVFFLKKL